MLSLIIMQKCNIIRGRPNVVTSIISSRHLFVSSLKNNYYKTLGITPNATMGEIKNAYYNLSMIYHPDKSDGSAEAIEKFRAVTEAYEVLSNLNSKKMYDKGFARSSPVNLKPKSRPKKKIIVPQEAGRTPVYDFEQWSRIHYGESVMRRAAAKREYVEQKAKRDTEVENEKATIVTCSITLMLFMCLALSSVSDSGSDKPSQSD